MTDDPEVPREILRCPVHDQTDCSPLLNGCTIPIRLAATWRKGYAEGYSDAGRLARLSMPYEPPGLRDLIRSTVYKRGWKFHLAVFREDGDEAPRGWRLHIISDTENSYADPPGSQRIRVNHAFCVPPASYSRDTWAAWIRDRIDDVEGKHEVGEFLMFDGVREFAPHHGNGEDPYRVYHVGDLADTRVKAGHDK